MKRPMLFFAISFIFAIVIFTYFESANFFVISLFVILVIVSLILKKKSMFLISIGLLCGFLYADFRFNDYDFSYDKLDNFDLDIYSKDEFDDINRYEAYTYRDNKRFKVIFYSENNYDIADNVVVYGNISTISKNSNPFLFNMRNYFIGKNIKYEIKEKELISKDISSNFMLNLKRDFNKYVDGIFHDNLSKKNADFATSVILSKSFDDGDNIRNLGLSHILVVSGLHIDLIIIFIIFFLNGMGIDYKISRIIAIIICALYGYFISFPFSVIRVLVMNFVSFLSFVFLRKEDKINSIALSSVVITLLYPFAILNISFVLSFAAMISIFVIYAKLFERYRWVGLKRYIYFLAIVQLSLMPFTVNYFGRFNLFSVFANFVILPLFTILLYMMVFSIFTYKILFIFKPLYFLLMNLLSGLILNITDFIYDFSLDISFVKEDSMAISVVCFLIIIAFVNLKKRYVLYNKIFLISIIALLSLDVAGDLFRKENSLYMIDIGQGDAFLLKDQNDYYLFDVGGPKFKDYDSGKRILVPVLKGMGVKDIKGVFISHSDSDHSGNLDILCQNFKVSNIISTDKFKDEFDKYDNFVSIKKDQVIKTNSGSIKCIYDGKGTNPNDNSMGLLVDINGYKFLTLGDLSKKYEDSIKIDTDILKVSHHGSKNSSSKEFIKNVSPSIALISAGRNNIYNHPSSKVIDNLFGIRIYNTQKDGFVKINFDDKISVDTYLKGGFFR